MGDNRFETIYKQGTFELFKVIRDNETGVLYLMNSFGSGGGLTVMVDQDGKPIVDENFNQ